MQKTPFLHASRIFPAIAAALLLVLTGCNITITNLTPDTVPQNPSQIYTITASFHPTSSQIDRSSIQPRIIIDGQIYKMAQSSVSRDVWEFDYQIPAGRSSASYYFICAYKVENQTSPTMNEVNSELQTMKIAGRYVIRPEATRAPVGSRVSVLGAGFTPADIVYFDHTPTRTVFESPSSLSFFVPAVEPSRNYRLSVTGSGLNLDVGTFRVDAISFQVTPASLVLRPGEQQALTFTIPTPAPGGGMLIDVTTDVPASVVMPEVIVPAGQSSVTVPVQGGKPGSGSLFFKSSAGDTSVSVTVTPKVSAANVIFQRRATRRAFFVELHHSTKATFPMIVFETSRLVLSRLTPDDAAFILELVNDPAWLRFIGDRGVRTLDDARGYILKGPVASYEKLGFGLFLVKRKEDGLPIGMCGLLKRETLPEIDIGFAFLPQFARQGYGFEAASATLTYGRRVLGLKRIVAITSPDNTASIRLLEKLGLQYEKPVRMTPEAAEISLYGVEF